MPRVEKLAGSKDGQSPKKPDNTSITRGEVQRLLTLTTKILSVCARVSGHIDPAVEAMIVYARDELLESAITEGKEPE